MNKYGMIICSFIELWW